MSATSIGQIGLDLVVNQKQFHKQMTGIQSLAKKAGATLAGAFAVTKLVQFGKECVDLGSDLQEVQNVVDVTFPNMSAKVNSFAKSAAASLGLSETMAKKYTGTLGSMAKAFGFSEEQAYDMGSTLTGLAGDVASFYNLSQDEAYTKLKSVFTGETESLKDLGVVMTQTALDSYALANGFGKTTSAMTEAEKVALRYAFVQDRLSAASGDFARTSGSWANQTKVLNLQFESLKATIGQGLISAFTPVLKIVNELIAKVQVLASSFKELMEGMFGAQDDAFSGAADSASAVSKSTKETAENLKKADKYLAGFDVVTKMSDTSSSDTTSTGGVNEGGATSLSSDIEASASGSVNKLEGLLSYIKTSFTPTFEKSMRKLKRPADDFKKIFSKTFTDIRNLINPFIKYLSGPFINYLKTAFYTASSICAGLFDSFNTVFEDVWNIAAYPLIDKLLNEWLPGYTDYRTKLCELTGTLFYEVKRIFDALWEDAGKPLLENLTNIFTDIMDMLNEFWYKWGEPIFSNLEEAVTNLGDLFLNWWELFLKPTFDNLMEAADEIWNKHLSPLVENFLDFVGEFVNGALEIYNNFIVPLTKWMQKILAPIFNSVFKAIVDEVSKEISCIIDFVNGIITSLKGVIQFVTGVFTGDWEKAWTGIKNFFKGIFDSLVAIVRNPVNAIIDIINGMIKGIVDGVNTVIKAINAISFEMPEWAGGQKIGFNLKTLSAPKIPKLWNGGYVKKNTPQLAMIGDNRHQGEVVAPEDKLKEMAMAAVNAASGNDYSLEILKILKEILEVLKALDLDIVIDGKKLKDIIVEKINEHTRQTGVCEIIL